MWCAVKGKPGSARPEGTPAIDSDLELESIRTLMQTKNIEIEQNTHA